MPTVNPYEQYKKQSIMTMTQGELVVQLFRGCSKRLNLAVHHMNENDIESAESEIYKAQRILNYLNASLDKNYDIANNLSALYDYFIRMIIKSKVKNNSDILKDIITMVDDLGDSFQEAERLVHKK